MYVSIRCPFAGPGLGYLGDERSHDIWGEGADVQDHEFKKPTSASGYLEAMTRIIMTSGINWHVVDAKWDGIREAFAGFDIEKVEDMTPEDVDRIMADPRVIRNRRKIEAVIDNAGKIAELDQSFGGFGKYLKAQGGYDKTAAALKHDFKFMGDSTVYFFLAMVGEDVPDWEQHAHAAAWRKAHEKSAV
jgi:3-methyladenine DNA glycosylase Tag